MDKCKVGIVYSKHPQGDELPWGDVSGVIEWAHSVKGDEFAEISAGRKGTYKRHKPPAPYTRAVQPLASGNSVRCLYGCHRGIYRAWVGLNPTMSQLGEVNFHLQRMFAQGFETLRRHGAVSECEFFVDVDHVEFDDYLFLDTGLRSAYQGFAPVGTMYLGSMHGKRSLTVYDKGKQLSEKAGVALSCPRLRIEAKVRGSTHRLKSLHEVPHPFATMNVIDRGLLDAVVSPSTNAFKHGLKLGLSAQLAFACLPKGHKAEMNDVLIAVRPSWWDPVNAWEQVRASLGWMDVLSHVGITGEYLPLGEAAYQSETSA